MLQMGGIWLIAGLLVGGVLAWILARSRGGAAAGELARATAEIAEKNKLLDAAREREMTLREQVARLGVEAARIPDLEQLLSCERAARSAAEQSSAALETKLGERSLWETAITTTFDSLAKRALGDNNEAFLTLAKTRLEVQTRDAQSALEAKETAIAQLLTPVQEALKNLSEETHSIESKRDEAYGAVLAEIRNLQQTHGDLRRETSQLVQALRAPKTRGSWGELQLKRCIEFAGMVEHCTFEKEVHIAGTPENEEALRPDVVVHLPNERCIVIDAKTPLDAFLIAMATEDEAARAESLRMHAAQVRKHLEQLQKKRYWDRLENAADFVVCFLPSEVLFSAALEADPSLIEYGAKDNVVLATPTTLISLLRAVAIGWHQLDVTRNAEKIKEAAKNLYDKLSTAKSYFEGVGDGLKKAVAQYNSLIGCVEGRDSVFAQARSLHSLGIGKTELDEISPLEGSIPRLLKSSHWNNEPGSGFEFAAGSEDPEGSKPS
jgi:DNA recombination protein RmuC